jgi:hypothetical protein
MGTRLRLFRILIQMFDLDRQISQARKECQA